VIIFIAICMTVLMGFAGLASDTAMVWVARSRLQNSVDAAVLAAAQELPAPDATTKAGATGVACDYATVRNAVPGMTGANCSGKADVTFPNENGTTIRVTAHRTVQPIFGQILGFGSVDVSAKAEAKIGSLGASCVFPFFMTSSLLTGSAFFAPVKFTNDHNAGGAIDVGSGASAIRDAMSPAACSSSPPKSFEGIVGQTVGIKPGALDQFKSGWDDIATAATTSSCPNVHVASYLVQDAAGRYELNPTVTLASCPRLVVIPVLDNVTSRKIIGFIPFYFALKCDSSTCNDPDVGTLSKNDFWGYYVRLDLTSLKYSDYRPEFGTQVVSLAG
jgi:hypothetical protein